MAKREKYTPKSKDKINPKDSINAYGDLLSDTANLLARRFGVRDLAEVGKEVMKEVMKKEAVVKARKLGEDMAEQLKDQVMIMAIDDESGNRFSQYFKEKVSRNVINKKDVPRYWNHVVNICKKLGDKDQIKQLFYEYGTLYGFNDLLLRDLPHLDLLIGNLDKKTDWMLMLSPLGGVLRKKGDGVFDSIDELSKVASLPHSTLIFVLRLLNSKVGNDNKGFLETKMLVLNKLEVIRKCINDKSPLIRRMEQDLKDDTLFQRRDATLIDNFDIGFLKNEKDFELYMKLFQAVAFGYYGVRDDVTKIDTSYMRDYGAIYRNIIEVNPSAVVYVYDSAFMEKYSADLVKMTEALGFCPKLQVNQSEATIKLKIDIIRQYKFYGNSLEIFNMTPKNLVLFRSNIKNKAWVKAFIKKLKKPEEYEVD